MLAFASISHIRDLIAKKSITPSEVLDYYLQRAATIDPKINSLLELFDRDSILAATSSTSESSLRGIPGVLKDNIAQHSRHLSCGSKILGNYKAPYDATVVARLKEQGALLMGRANLDEFAMGSSTENSAFFVTKNPWDTTRVPGGSSGGSAAAVAAGIAPWALGSETGGSVRQPAGFCGIVGIKPTYGHISRYGLVAYASSLDQIGVLTRTVYDNALVFSAIAGADQKDSTCAPRPAYNYTQNLTGTIPEGLTIGVVQNIFDAEGIDPEVKEAMERTVHEYEKMKARIVRISLPTFEYGAATYFIISRAEAASNLARFDGVRYGMRDEQARTLLDMYCNTRHDGFGSQVKSRILVGNYVLSAGYASKLYEHAKKVQALMRAELTRTFEEVDVILLPSQSTPAFTIGAFDNNKLQMDLQDYVTCPANLTGAPALSVPCGFSAAGLPIGFQLMGPHFSEALLYQVAHAYETRMGWFNKVPQL